MNLNNDIVYRCLRLGPPHQLHPGRSRSVAAFNRSERNKGKTIIGAHP